MRQSSIDLGAPFIKIKGIQLTAVFRIYILQLTIKLPFKAKNYLLYINTNYLPDETIIGIVVVVFLSASANRMYMRGKSKRNDRWVGNIKMEQQTPA